MSDTPSYFIAPNGTRIAYHKTEPKDKSKPTIIFIHGFKSDMQGTKALMLETFCTQHNVGFIRFDCSGHGQSDGDFIDGTIGKWAEDTIHVIDKLSNGTIILVGSSMGGWLMLLAACKRPERIAALVGIAAAPDFVEDLIWDVITPEEQTIIMREGIYNLPQDYCNDPDAEPEPYPITRKLVEEARQHLLLREPIDINCPIRLIHGMNDADVPPSTAEKIKALVNSKDVEIIYQEHGDHRMSEPEDLKLIQQVVTELL